MDDADKVSTQQAHQALTSWWEAAGVEVPPAPAPKNAGPKAKSAGQHQPTARQDGMTASAPTPQPRKADAIARPPDNQQPKLARKTASTANSLDELKTALEGFDAGLVKENARNTVFARGNADADIMVIGEAPGRDEDAQGLPFVGQSGQLLDRILAAAGLGPDNAYITNAFNWRPPQNRKPTPDELAMCLPFLERHIALKAPKIIILVGATPLQSILQINTGITRARGQWHDYAVKEADGSLSEKTIPTLPTFHPAFLLRAPLAKRDVWRDVQSVAARLAEIS